MRSTTRQMTTWMALVALTFAATPARARSGAVLEGRLMAVDGRAAEGFRLQLIDEHGEEIAGAPVDSEGQYAFADLSEGSYALGVVTPEGRRAPVASPAVRLAAGQRLRHDVKLVTATAEGQELAAGTNYGCGLWWASLSRASKAWVLLSGLAIVGITVAAVGSDDDEPASSPVMPPPALGGSGS